MTRQERGVRLADSCSFAALALAVAAGLAFLAYLILIPYH